MCFKVFVFGVKKWHKVSNTAENFNTYRTSQFTKGIFIKFGKKGDKYHKNFQPVQIFLGNLVPRFHQYFQVCSSPTGTEHLSEVYQGWPQTRICPEWSTPPRRHSMICTTNAWSTAFLVIFPMSLWSQVTPASKPHSQAAGELAHSFQCIAQGWRFNNSL